MYIHYRLQIFCVVYLLGKNYTVHYTGTSPQDSRMYLLNAGDDEGVVMAIWYAQPWRLDVYVDDVYQLPQNGYYNSAGQLVYRNPSYPGEYIPTIATDSTGSNYFDRDTQNLHVLLKGSPPVTITTNPLIFVAIQVPFQSVDDFFGAKIVENLAAFFNIPKDKIRVAEAVRESRRRRDVTDTMTFTLEVTNAPSATVNVSQPGDVTLSELQQMTSKLVDMYQLDIDTLQSYLNITLLSLTVTEPPPPTDSQQWKTVTSEVADSQTAAVAAFTPSSLQVPTTMYLATHPTVLHEGSAFPVQPALGFKGINVRGN